MKQSGVNVQTLSHACQEQPWFRASLCDFGDSASGLPFDHHMLMGLVAPRGLLIIDNTSMEWLGNVACYSCAAAGQLIFEALGVTDNMGYSQVGGHDHCAFPSSQQPELSAYIGEFLLGQGGDIGIMKTDGGYSFDESKWVDWDTPNIQ
jgi:hypothetical protein